VHTDRPSLTASLVAAVRALYTALPEPYRLAADPLAVELVPGALALPARVAARVPWAASAIHRGLGVATLGLNYHVELRTRAIDDALRDAVRGGMTQLVLLGAGLDSRTMRLGELGAVTAFEVDHPSSQQYKIERLAALPRPPRPMARRIERVAMDFERDRLDRVLPAAGFRPDERSFWIWEGVTAYLTPEAVVATMGAVAGLSAPGSRLALTYTPAAVLPGLLKTAAELVASAVSEPLRSVLEPETIAGMLGDVGFGVLSDESTADWAARYWPWQGKVRVIERLAIGERKVAVGAKAAA
jgi:methyltransferase (TIGR00027 family)